MHGDIWTNGTNTNLKFVICQNAACVNREDIVQTGRFILDTLNIIVDVGTELAKHLKLVDALFLGLSHKLNIQL